MAEYRASGLSRVEFCRRRGFSVATLARYLKRQAQDETLPADRWVAAEVSGACARPDSAAGGGLAVALPGGRRIEVGRGFDACTLVQLLGVLERI